MRGLLALLLMPTANAAVVYDLTVRPVDQNMALAAPTPPAIVTHYVVDEGRVRVGGSAAKMAYLFIDQTMIVIDFPARTAHLLKHATLQEVERHYTDAVKQLAEAAAALPPYERAAAERKAADMKSVSDRLRAPVVRTYRVTARFESVDGRACRVWEESESGAKRLELCVAPTASITGGPEILRGMKTLSGFRQGANFAFNVDFGLSPWWADLARLGGVPLLVREYKYDSLVSETMLSGMQSASPDSSLWGMPDGYQVQEGPDYAQWYMR